MPSTVERVGGLLYRVGMRHDDGQTSLVSFAAGPARIVANELAASVADVLVSRSRAGTEGGRGSRRGADLGPSTP